MIALVPRDSLIGMLIGPTVWMAAFVIMYTITGTACALGYATASISGLNAMRFFALLVAAISAIVIFLAGMHAFRHWQDVRRTMVDADELPIRQRHEFLYLSAIALSAISLVGTVWMAIAVMMNPICLE